MRSQLLALTHIVQHSSPMRRSDALYEASIGLDRSVGESGVVL